MSDDPKTIEHDPHELPRRVRDSVALLTIVVALAITIPSTMGIRWFIERVPFAVVTLVDGLMFGASLGYFVGRWDVLRQLAPEDLPAWWHLRWEDTSAFLKYAAYLFVLSPFAVFIVPAKAWARARRDGDSKLLSAQHAAAGVVFGLMITLLAAIVIGVPMELAFGS